MQVVVKRRISVREFMGRVNDLCDIVDQSVRFLNWGGCCVFAALMGRKLSKYGKVQIRVVKGYDESDKSIEDIEPFVKNKNDVGDWMDNGLHFYHVIIEFSPKGSKQVFHIDSTGVKKAKSRFNGKKLINGCFSVEQARDFAKCSEYGRWNSVFDRGQIPAMQKTIRGYNFF